MLAPVAPVGFATFQARTFVVVPDAPDVPVIPHLEGFYFEQGTPEYHYYAEPEADGTVKYSRSWSVELLVNKLTGVLAIWVWVTDAQIERANDAISKSERMKP